MASKKVDTKIKNSKVMMFAKSYCPHCKKAKATLAEYGVNYDFWDIDGEDDNTQKEIQDYLKTLTGASSVPRIFHNGKPVGGNDDLQEMAKKDQLKALKN